MQIMYSFEGKLKVMQAQEVAAAIAKCERIRRTSEFNYVDQPIIQSQVDEAKNWPGEMLEFFKQKAKAAAGSNPVGKMAIRQAFIDVATHLAAKRQPEQIMFAIRDAIAELNLATVFGRAPDISMSKSRSYHQEGPLFRVMTSLMPRHLIVNMAEIETADYYVLAHFTEQVNKSILLGFATKDDLKEAKQKEEENTAEWKSKAYYIPLPSLRPMAELYRAFKLSEIPTGLAMETPPQPNEIPMKAGKALQEMADVGKADDFDFLSAAGIKKDEPSTKNE